MISAFLLSYSLLITAPPPKMSIMTNALITDTEKRANIQLDEEYKQFLCVFYSTAVEGILLNWFTSKERADKQLVCDMIRKTVTSSFQGILGSNS